MLHIEPVTLVGQHVRLEPLNSNHADDLFEAGCFPEIWQYMSIAVEKDEDIHMMIDKALANQQAGSELPFAIIHQPTGKAIGSTRFMNISRQDRGLEIGWTWLTPAVWKSPVNTECKWLLLRHCFETLGCIRVQLKTDARNLNSQRAIARIGGVKEGVLRNHMITRNDYVRDSVYFSILDREWPEVERKLKLCLFGE